MSRTNTHASDDNLPVPSDSNRTYIRIQPSNDSFDGHSVKAQFQRFHRLATLEENTGVLSRLLRRTPTTTTIEFLLLTTGDSSIEYWIGLEDDEHTSGLEQTLRSLFPDSYQFERIVRSGNWLAQFTDTPEAESEIAAVEFLGKAARRRDWQTQLTSFETFLTEANTRVPLAAVAEAMAESTVPMVYQALLRPKADWTHLADDRRGAIEANQDTIRDQIENAVFGVPEDGLPLRPSDAQRIEELIAKDAYHSFDCQARVIACDEDETRCADAIRSLTSAFGDVNRTCYELTGRKRTGTAGHRIADAIRNRKFRTASALRARLPGRARIHPTLVVDAAEAPNFCLLGGESLTSTGSRAVATTPGEQTGVPTPPASQLAQYRGDGLTLGQPLKQDDTLDTDPLVLPPALQPMHVGWFGKTGSGKSTAIINAILTNHAATAGADILIDPKGDGMAEEYLRAHYATYGDLENVLYFDCARILPAFSFFDIRDELEAGVPRSTAVEDTVDHYIEILTQIMGQERFEQAVRSPDIIRYLVKATFDPVNGQDVFSHRDLHTTIRQMHERQAAPAVSDDDLERMLGGVVANRARSFDEIMQGVANRVEKIPLDRRLARIFNHVPERDADAHFDLASYLDEDVVVIFDTGKLRSEAQRVLTILILSNLWTALRRRAQRTDGSHPLVNLYIEEAASIAVSDLLKQLLSQSRSFECSVTLAMQFPAQLKGHDQEAYEELLNNISTFVSGNVAVDRLLAHRLATDDMDVTAVGNRLRALRRGQWFVSLPAEFGAPEPRPFLMESLPLPPGDPTGPQPFTDTEEAAFTDALANVEALTVAEAGVTLSPPTEATQAEPAPESDPEPPTRRVDSALAYTKRLPPTVEYDAETHALCCTEDGCYNRYDPSIEGMVRAISCCSSLEDVNRDDIPICDLNLKLTPEERLASDWSDHQLIFLQAVYNAQQLRYDPLEYDLLSDSMIRLREYVDIETDALQDLLDADLLRHDTDHPHRLYTVTPTGRSVIGENYREGVDYGHGKGDLEESSHHVFGVEVARQYLEREYCANPESPVTEVIPYYDIDERRRLDLAGIDADGDIVVTVEVERINHDVKRAAPDDFDKMAACDPDEAIWIVMSRSAGHTVLDALNKPAEGPPRVEKTYSQNTPPQQFRIDTPGLTAIYPAEYMRDSL